MDVHSVEAVQCYLPTGPGEILVWSLVLGGVFVLAIGFGLVALDEVKRRATVHTLHFTEHMLLHGSFYGSIYAGWIGLENCGFKSIQIAFGIVLAISCAYFAYGVGKWAAEREAREHNEEQADLLNALIGKTG